MSCLSVSAANHRKFLSLTALAASHRNVNITKHFRHHQRCDAHGSYWLALGVDVFYRLLNLFIDLEIDAVVGVCEDVFRRAVAAWEQ